jgi:hypothetical protein
MERATWDGIALCFCHPIPRFRHNVPPGVETCASIYMGGMSTGMRNSDAGKWSLALKAKNHPGVLPVWLSKNISSVQPYDYVTRMNSAFVFNY